MSSQLIDSLVTALLLVGLGLLGNLLEHSRLTALKTLGRVLSGLGAIDVKTITGRRRS